MFWVLVMILIFCALFGAPGVGVIHHGYGYYPSGLLTVVVIVLIVLLLSGRL